MLKFASIVGYTSCGPTYIESFLTIFGQCINVLNYKTYLLACDGNTEIPSLKLEATIISRNLLLAMKY